MKHTVAIILFALGSFLSAFGNEESTNAAINKALGTKGTRVWISAFAPITLSTEAREWPTVGAYATPDIPLDICRQWRTNYAVFRQLLISTAEKQHLDSTTLAKVLPELDLEKSQIIALLPVEVHFAEVKGEWAWVITYYWEYTRDEPGRGGMSHIMQEALSQKTLKMVWRAQCD